jgi:hypothetical protein
VAVRSALIGGLSWWRAIESAKVAAECASTDCQPQYFFGVGFTWTLAMPFAYLFGGMATCGFLGIARLGHATQGWWTTLGYTSVVLLIPPLCWLWTIAGCSALWHVCVIAGPPVVAGSLVACEREIA